MLLLLTPTVSAAPAFVRAPARPSGPVRASFFAYKPLPCLVKLVFELIPSTVRLVLLVFQMRCYLEIMVTFKSDASRPCT